MTDQVTFTAGKSELAAGLAWASKALPKRPPVPILAGMLVTAEAGRVTLTAFDYDVATRTTVTAEGTSAGTVLVRGHELVKAVRGLPSGKGARVSATVDGEALRLESGGVTARVELLPLEEYPQLPAMPEPAGVMDSGAFAAAILRVAPAASRDDTLPVLCAVNMRIDAGEVRLAATDRYRLAVESVPWTPATEAEWNVNLPAYAAEMFGKAAAKDGKVTLHLVAPAEDETEPYDSHIGLTDGTRELIVRSTPHEFPNMDRFLLSQGEFRATAEVDAPSLAAALKRAGAAADRATPAHLKVTREGITVTALRGGEVASEQTLPGTLECDLTGDDGQPVSELAYAYNPAYLGSVVAGIGGRVRLAWAGLNKPVHVSPVDEGSTFRALVMNIRNAG